MLPVIKLAYFKCYNCIGLDAIREEVGTLPTFLNEYVQTVHVYVHCMQCEMRGLKPSSVMLLRGIFVEQQTRSNTKCIGEALFAESLRVHVRTCTRNMLVPHAHCVRSEMHYGYH